MESLARTDREVQELSELWRGLRRLARESELNSVGQGGGYRKEDHIAWKAADWIARLEARAILNNAEGDSL